jgi:two-component system response regulator HydG
MATPNRVLTLASVAPEAAPTQTLLTDPSKVLAGPSAAMAKLNAQIRRVAPYFRTALLTGEPNCGEESTARALHTLSPMASRPFLRLTAAEAQQRFGASIGYESVAAEGLLYLPQPERLPRTTQTALLRLVRERGPHAPRIVVFAERGLRPLVSSGAFSTELADTLGALRIAMPPLRERPEDIPSLLGELILDRAHSLRIIPPDLTADLFEQAAKSSWPGNLLQLAATASALLDQSSESLLSAHHLHIALGNIPQPPAVDRREVRMVKLDRIIHEHIRAVLFACNGNKLRAAEILGISRSTLYRMLESPLPEEASAPAASSLSMAG